jgi:HAD superfamily hydrolase (TIGR01450 family)
MVGLRGSRRPLSEVFDLAILDLDGVVYIGDDAVPGAAEAIEQAAARGLRPCYVTNNASRTPDTVAEHLVRLGVPAGVEDVLTSAQVAAALLARRLPAGSRVLVVGGTGLRVALTTSGLVPVASMDDGPAAVVQGFSPDIDWRLLAEGTRAVRAGLPWVASNLDLTVPTPFGPAPGNGSLVHLVATAAGREPDEVAGKPMPQPFLEAARRYAAVRPLVIGDRLDTDLEGARAADMPGLAVLTGVSTAGDLVRAAPHVRPTYIGIDLGSLLVPHPDVVVSVVGPTVSATCVDAVVAVSAGTVARGARLEVSEPGKDAVDLLRAACGAAWAYADGQNAVGAHAASLDLNDVLASVQRLDATATWAR